MKITSVNIAPYERTISLKNGEVSTGIFKKPVKSRCDVLQDGLRGDHIVVARKGGRLEQAISVYPEEHYAYWNRELGRADLEASSFGENFTTRGLLESEVRIGDIFQVGTAILQVSHPRMPCRKLNALMGGSFSKQFLRSFKVGYYMRVLECGEVGADDTMRLQHRDEHSPSVRDFTRIAFVDYWDSEGLQNLLQAHALTDEWKDVIRSKLERALLAPRWLGTRPLQVAEAIDEARDLKSYVLRCPYDRPLPPHRGGELLPLVFPSEGKSSSYSSRAFALSGDPTRTDHYRITARVGSSPRFLSGGSATSYLETNLAPGDQIRASSPVGSFVLDNDSGPRVFITEGLGLAPIASMLWELKHSASNSPAVLLHSDINHATHPLRVEIAQLCHDTKTELQIFYRGVTREDEAGRYFHHRGWASPTLHESYPLWVQEATFWLSGSETFAGGVQAQLQDDGVPQHRIRTELFGRGEDTDTTVEAIPEET